MKKALIIDDDQGVIEALQAALELWEFESLGIKNTQNIVATIADEKPDIIFLDLLLSGTDGAAVTNIIRSQAKFNTIPIILMSAHPTAKEISTQIAVDGFLPKPFDLENLLGLIKQILP